MPLTISIIIPTLNEQESIQQSIQRAWLTGCDEVIVADGGSRDQTEQICQSLDCVLIQSEPGRGVQLNAGAKQASSDVLLFLHADNWLAPDGCQQIRDCLASSDIDYGAFQQRIENPSFIYRWIEYGNEQRIRWRGLVYGDQALFIRKTLFDQLGGFPEISIMEDLQFSRALKRHGRPAVLAGPTMVGARRWETNGVLRQTLRNWWLSSLFLLGASPEWIRNQYRPHRE